MWLFSVGEARNLKICLEKNMAQHENNANSYFTHVNGVPNYSSDFLMFYFIVKIYFENEIIDRKLLGHPWRQSKIQRRRGHW